MNGSENETVEDLVALLQNSLELADHLSLDLPAIRIAEALSLIDETQKSKSQT